MFNRILGDWLCSIEMWVYYPQQEAMGYAIHNSKVRLNEDKKDEWPPVLKRMGDQQAILVGGILSDQGVWDAQVMFGASTVNMDPHLLVCYENFTGQQDTIACRLDMTKYKKTQKTKGKDKDKAKNKQDDNKDKDKDKDNDDFGGGQGPRRNNDQDGNDNNDSKDAKDGSNNNDNKDSHNKPGKGEHDGDHSSNTQHAMSLSNLRLLATSPNCVENIADHPSNDIFDTTVLSITVNNNGVPTTIKWTQNDAYCGLGNLEFKSNDGKWVTLKQPASHNWGSDIPEDEREYIVVNSWTEMEFIRYEIGAQGHWYITPNGTKAYMYVADLWLPAGQTTYKSPVILGGATKALSPGDNIYPRDTSFGQFHSILRMRIFKPTLECELLTYNFGLSRFTNAHVTYSPLYS